MKFGSNRVLVGALAPMIVSLLGAAPAAQARPQRIAQESSAQKPLMAEEAFKNAFAQDAGTEDLAVLSAVQRPISPACITVPVKRPLWKDVPSWFLVAEEDRMILPETQRFMAGRMKATVRAHTVDHTPIVTAPHVVVEIIREAIRSVAG